MTPGTDPGFDRLRPRSARPTRDRIPGDEARPQDRDGKRALFSEVPAPPATGGVALLCPACGARSVLSWQRAARLAVPGLYVPLPRVGTRAWVRCPACQRRGWLEVSLRG